jgi:glycosyltransferase involved in cell wall biosynthesis
MKDSDRPLRVLHSFPHRLGRARICTTAWYEIDSTASNGAEVIVYAGDSVRPFNRDIRVQTTLSKGKLRIPYKLLGTMRSCMLHDWIVSRALPKIASSVDIIHAWPLAALRTIKIAKALGIPVALERCNAHTRYAYQIVQEECKRIGVSLPKSHEHAYNSEILEREEAEYKQADGILCPSDFVVKTFLDAGFESKKLVRFIYGVDETVFFPKKTSENGRNNGLRVLFAGVCAVRKGLHFAVDAWLKSSACSKGTFLIAGEFIPEYKQKMSEMLRHPSIKILGHRNDIPELMRNSDLFVLPSIEEGFGLVCTEAMASGCVPLVSTACTDLCRHEKNALRHNVGDVNMLSEQFSLLNERRDILWKLREGCTKSIDDITWNTAGKSLLKAYHEIAFAPS